GKKDARVKISLEVEDEPVEAPKTERAPALPHKQQAVKQQAAEEEIPVVKELIRTRNEDAGKPGRGRGRVKEAAAPYSQAEAKAAPKKAEGGEQGHKVGAGKEAEQVKRLAMSFLNPIFNSMKVMPQEEIQVRDGILWLVFSGQGLGSLIGRRGETLNSLQYLTNLAVNREYKEHVRLVLDVEGYRAGREETLVALAKRMAEKAVRSGRRVELEPMNPHERRIVHITLQDDKRVDTASQGEEPFRRVVIYRHRTDNSYNKNNYRKKYEGKGDTAKMSLSQQLGQQFSEQVERRH
ncbi:MAG: KH domain-containing protein, partial [Clostridiales bacterium]|nr:KH domain-containing protein [Clostridiales bacterium]